MYVSAHDCSIVFVVVGPFMCNQTMHGSPRDYSVAMGFCFGGVSVQPSELEERELNVICMSSAQPSCERDGQMYRGVPMYIMPTCTTETLLFNIYKGNFFQPTLIFSAEPSVQRWESFTEEGSWDDLLVPTC